MWKARAPATRDSSVELSFDQRSTTRPPPPGDPPPPRWRHGEGPATASEIDAENPPPRRRRPRRSSSTYTDVDDPSRESTLDTGAHLMPQSTLLVSRVALSALSIGMLWCSSLSVITRMLHESRSLPIPAVDAVVHESVALYNETTRLRRTYLECVQSELGVCNATLVRRRDREAERSERARRQNAQTRDHSRAVQGACASAHAQAMASVSAWQQQRGAGGGSQGGATVGAGDGSTGNNNVAAGPGGGTVAVGSHYKSSCTAGERDELERMTGDTTAQRTAAYQLVHGYSQSSQSTVGLLASQLEARAEYDRIYLYNKTLRELELDAELSGLGLNFSHSLSMRFDGLNLSQVLACSTLVGGACPDGRGAREMVAAAQQNLVDQYGHAQRTYARTANTTKKYVEDSTQALADVASTLQQIRDDINTRFPEVGFSGFFPSVTIPSVCPSDPFTGEFSCRVSAPNIQLQLDDVSNPIDLDAIAASTNAARERYEQSLQSSIDYANVDASHLGARLDGVEVSTGFPPPDYQPPTIDAGGVQREHAKESDEFEQDAAVSLDAIDQAERTSNRSSSYRPIFATNISASRLPSSLTDTSWFSYRFLEDAGVTFEWLLAPLRAIGNLLQLLDVIWRCIETVRILRRFWGRSSLVVAPIDVTTDAESKSRASKLLSPMQGLAILVTHPLMLLASCLVFAFLVGGVAFSLYQPAFSAYQTNCTAKDALGRPVGDGTVLTRNAYAIAFNYASYDGNRLRLGGIDEYELARADACARYGERSANDEERVQKEMDAIVGSHVRMQADVALMRRCYDTSVLDASFTAAPVSDAQGHDYPLLSVTLAAPACDEQLDNSTLADGVFDCAELPDCDVSCDDLADENGIDHSQLYDYARGAMCTAQWWFHSTVLRMVFTVSIWIFVNLFRVLFVAGLIRLGWQYLNTGFFTYLATTNIDGEHTYKEEDLADKVRAMLGCIRLEGFALIVLASVTQLPWCVALYHFALGLTPS